MKTLEDVYIARAPQHLSAPFISLKRKEKERNGKEKENVARDLAWLVSSVVVAGGSRCFSVHGLPPQFLRARLTDRCSCVVRYRVGVKFVKNHWLNIILLPSPLLHAEGGITGWLVSCSHFCGLEFFVLFM